MSPPALQPSSNVELSIVMPCLNEADTVATCVRKALGGLAAAGIAGEVIVADNGSSDGSIALAEAAGERVGGGSVSGDLWTRAGRSDDPGAFLVSILELKRR
jgi:GT2 family glycosyltransferase